MSSPLPTSPLVARPASPTQNDSPSRDDSSRNEDETASEDSRRAFIQRNRDEYAFGEASSALTNHGSDTETWMDFLRSGQSNAEGESEENDGDYASQPQPSGVKRTLRGSTNENQNRQRSRYSRLNLPREPDETVTESITPPFINLSTPPQSIQRGSSTASRNTRRSREIILPRWQPDAEVSNCPICGTKFSFWYRKHHCRKCGRVVCGLCSPHRITIPRQFIVHPPSPIELPDQEPPTQTAVIGLTDEDNEAAFPSSSRRRSTLNTDGPDPVDPALGGGGEVRICNPCVPDPNYAPPPQSDAQQYANFSYPHQDDAARDTPETRRAEESQRHRHSVGSQYPGLERRRQQYMSAQDQYMGLSASGVLSIRGDEEGDSGVPEHLRRPSAHIYHDAALRLGHHRHSHQPRYASHQYEADVAGPSTSAPGLDYFRSRGRRGSHRVDHGSPSAGSNHARYRSLMDLEHGSSSRYSPSYAATGPALGEEDFCPVCQEILPRKGPDGSDAAREEHVKSCIASHFSSSQPRVSQPPPSSAATSAAILATAATPAQAQGQSSLPLSTRPRPRRGTGNRMLVYLATEKDCVGGAGVDSAAECVICFEEFEPGAELARLECLCKFHRACIRAWWDTKGAGACPVHQTNCE